MLTVTLCGIGIHLFRRASQCSSQPGLPDAALVHPNDHATDLDAIDCAEPADDPAPAETLPDIDVPPNAPIQLARPQQTIPPLTQRSPLGTWTIRLLRSR